MSALQKLKAMQAELDQIERDIEYAEEKRASLKGQIEFALEIYEEMEETTREKTESDSAALATLYLAHKTGAITDSDFRTFCEETSLDLPEVEEIDEEDTEAPPVSATG